MQPWFIEFAEAVDAGDGEYLRCTDCEEAWLPPRRHCPDCHNGELEAAPMPTTGEVASHTTISTTIPAFADDAPYTIVFVEFDEGIALAGQYRGDGDVAVGDRVDLDAEPVDDGWIFTFAPA